MANDLLYQIKITAEDKASTVINDAAGRARDASGRFVKMGEDSTAAARSATAAQTEHGLALTALAGKVAGVAVAYVAFQTAVNLVWELVTAAKELGTAAVDTAGKYEQLRNALDTVTGGHGDTWFEQLNAWAKVMPGNTAEAVDAFKKLRSMGVQPTIKDMTTLKDTVVAVGGGDEAFSGIVTALGQMQAKGKASAEELMQLAERGVPAYAILREELKLTGAQVADIGNQAIPVEKVMEALMAGLQKRFGGAAAGMADTWEGMTQTLESEWEDFLRLVGDAGVMDYAKAQIKALLAEVQRMAETGDLERWARKTSEALVNLGTIVTGVVKVLGTLARGVVELGSNAGPWLRVLEVLASLPLSPLSGFAGEISRLRVEYEAAYAASQTFADATTAVAGVFREATAAIVEHYDALAAAAKKSSQDEVAQVAAVLAVRRQQRDVVIALAEEEAAARQAALDKAGLAEQKHAAEAKAIEESLSQARLGALQAYAASAQQIYDQVIAHGRKLQEELTSLQAAQKEFAKTAADLILETALNTMNPTQKVAALKREIMAANAELRTLVAKGDAESLKQAEEQLKKLASLYKQMESAASPAQKPTIAQEAAQDVQRGAELIGKAWDAVTQKTKDAATANEAAAKQIGDAVGDATDEVNNAKPQIEVVHNAEVVKAEILAVLNGLSTTGTHTVLFQDASGKPYAPASPLLQEGQLVIKAVTEAAQARVDALAAPQTKEVAVAVVNTAEAASAFEGLTAAAEKAITVHPIGDAAVALFEALIAPAEKPVTLVADATVAQETLEAVMAPAEKSIVLHAEADAAQDVIANALAPEEKSVTLEAEAAAFKALLRELLKPETKIITIEERRKGGGNSSGDAGGEGEAPGYATGVILPGYGGGDIIPARLEPGEAVTDKETVRFFGAQLFRDLKRARTGEISLSELAARIQHAAVDLRIPVRQITEPLRYSAGGLAPAPAGGLSGGHWGTLTLEVGGREFQVVSERAVAADLAEQLTRARLAGVSRAPR
ncbi:tape measure protein [Megalodesulfovibrio gigas]|uniref:Putative phage tape measure protein n=1 Tax=Megalodesulfovibrio gigas (strain ATCC 19364 / DSM 1382 / NCIMB 9332 / VKM B-1759) TaxID=1121448 RepID=T2GDD3_MEGG1|nr:tape measure protein [Megalodesulfovibrio gigas]AGW14121.1 putative phage tape measure protein [Megalodesulfovibrio gigas DSM 1382 = ATCC 19364]